MDEKWKFIIFIIAMVIIESIIAISGFAMIYINMPMYNMKAQSEYKKFAFLMLLFILLIIPVTLIVAYLIKKP